MLFRELDTDSGQRLGYAQLNAEKALNALSLDMIRRLAPMLRQWASDPRVACVILTGTGEKAFCAGGDVRSLRDAILAHPGPGPNPQAEAFFGEEYRLDHLIHTYPKPLLVWGGGIVMGGGLGLMAGASHRVVTEHSRIAMPEVSIGLYPDVGGSWFLPRMPGRIGLFLALTGASLNGADALAVGLADFFLKTADREPLLNRLSRVAWTARPADNHAALAQALRIFAEPATAARPASNVLANAATIERLTEADSLAEVQARITGYSGDDAWLKRAAATLAGGSPTSIALIWEIARRAKHLSLADAFRMELIVSLRCCEHPDFAEGVRALLVDKDHRPRWTPATLAEVADESIAGHFQAPWSALANEAHPLAAL
ncbi:MAG: enoyl-CoA hydratase/isomerase family protein [Nevskia sp.]